MRVPDLMAGWPYPVAVAALWVVVLLRAGATYALGRGAYAGAGRTRLARLAAGPAFARGQRLVERWGAPVVTLCFLTVGVQTVVNLAAGLARMPLRRYLPALALGGLVWAVVYATAGSVGFVALRLLWRTSPVAAVVVGAVLLAALAGYVAVQVARRRAGPDDGPASTVTR